jgi:hypothetical protein
MHEAAMSLPGMEAPEMTKLRLIRTARGAGIALVLAVLWAAPAAAAEPMRTVLHPTGGLHPAGQGCAFDISYVDAPGARITVTDFSDGREISDVHAVATLTNDETGATFVHKAFFHDVNWLDAANGVYRGMTNGQSVFWFFPGDVGPYGIVGADGLALRIEGTIWYSADATTFAITEFAYNGTATNVCTLLS